MSQPCCVHCNLPIPSGERIAHPDEAELGFCCRGCLGAYRIIHEAGLEAFYERRSWEESGTAAGSFDTRFSEQMFEDALSSDGDGFRLNLLVEGIRCASCVWLIERLVGEMPGVRRARVNFATHRLQVHFDENRTSAVQIAERIARLGYLPRPFSARQQQLRCDRERRSLLIRFSAAAFLSMQLMGYSAALYAGYFKGMEPATRHLLQILAAAVATPVIFYGGAPFLRGGLQALRRGAPNMDLLISLGVLCAYGYSIFGLVAGGEVYFDSAAMIVTLILLGRIFESMARGRASAAVDRLLQLAPEKARVVKNASSTPELHEYALREIETGQVIRVYPGETVPLDGRLLSEETEIDASVVSGESRSVVKRRGEEVLAGCVNLTSSVDLEVSRTAPDSFLARMASLVEEAQARRAPVQRMADRISSIFVPAVIALAVATAFFWGVAMGNPGAAWLCAISVLVVACPCALGLATPTAILVASGAAAREGILFRGGDILESAARVRTLAFDKTGTLTLGAPLISEILSPVLAEDDLLRLAAEAECGSSHPLGRAVCAEAKRRGILVSPPEQHRARAGLGVESISGGRLLLVGSRRFLEEAGIVCPSEATDRTEVHIACDGSYLGTIRFEDRLRPQAGAAIRELRRSRIRCLILTGDRREVAEPLAEELGLSGVCSELSPLAKAQEISGLRCTGAVMMIGDGINDAPALAEADVGCAMSGGTDIALESSDLVLTRPDLLQLPRALALARRTLRIIRQNLFWAFSYNLVAIPLAASGLLAPVYSAAAMIASSILVLANSLRLRRFKERF